MVERCKDILDMLYCGRLLLISLKTNQFAEILFLIPEQVSLQPGAVITGCAVHCGWCKVVWKIPINFFLYCCVQFITVAGKKTGRLRSIGLKMRTHFEIFATTETQWWEINELCNDAVYRTTLNHIPHANCESIVLYIINDRKFSEKLGLIIGMTGTGQVLSLFCTAWLVSVIFPIKHLYKTEQEKITSLNWKCIGKYKRDINKRESTK